MFNKATVKLTIQYSLMLIAVLWMFSIGVYLYMDHNFGGDYRASQRSAEFVDQHAAGASEAVDVGLDKLGKALLLTNMLLILGVPVMSFFLARKTLKPLGQAYDKQQQFVDDASHELRTPLAVISGELELALQKERSVKNYKETISTSLAETRSMTELTHNLLKLARFDKRHQTIQMQTINVDKVLQKVVAQLTCQAQKKGLQLTRTSAESLLVNGNQTMLEQLFRNILDNAIKYSPPNAKITVTLRQSGDHLAVQINDQGSGMNSTEIAHAFDRFWRADQSRSTSGHGLGLPIAQQIAKLHGGKIELLTNKQKGMIVVVRLPRVNS